MRDANEAWPDEDLIWHYTGSAATFNIVESHSLRASDLRFSNDTTETSFGIKTICDELEEEAQRVLRDRPYSPAIDGDELTEDDPQYWADQLRALGQLVSVPSDYNSYGICFTHLRDSLSQWRGYAQGGCALGFDPNTMWDITGQDYNLNLEEVLYGQEAVSAARARAKAFAFNKIPSGTKRMSLGMPIEDELPVLARLASCMKHQGFEEEKELRALISVYPPASYLLSPIIKYNAKPDGRIVPFIPVPFRITAIKRIRVGPGIHQAANVTALNRWSETVRSLPRGEKETEAHAEQRGSFGPHIVASATPYR